VHIAEGRGRPEGRGAWPGPEVENPPGRRPLNGSAAGRISTAPFALRLPFRVAPRRDHSSTPTVPDPETRGPRTTRFSPSPGPLALPRPPPPLLFRPPASAIRAAKSHRPKRIGETCQGTILGRVTRTGPTATGRPARAPHWFSLVRLPQPRASAGQAPLAAGPSTLVRTPGCARRQLETRDDPAQRLTPPPGAPGPLYLMRPDHTATAPPPSRLGTSRGQVESQRLPASDPPCRYRSRFLPAADASTPGLHGRSANLSPRG